VSNGTAVLGLGNLGPLAAKPVMEGKALPFKRLADIDAFDLEIDVTHPEALVNVVKAIAPTFGGINLEDIKAPECFVVEESLRGGASGTAHPSANRMLDINILQYYYTQSRGRRCRRWLRSVRP